MICRVCPRCEKRMYSAGSEEKTWKCIYCGAPVFSVNQVNMTEKPKRQAKEYHKKHTENNSGC
jgi:tRNA(Ile2) C34 agmatinyltransferase TiaS